MKKTKTLTAALLAALLLLLMGLSGCSNAPYRTYKDYGIVELSYGENEIEGVYDRCVNIRIDDEGFWYYDIPACEVLVHTLDANGGSRWFDINGNEVSAPAEVVFAEARMISDPMGSDITVTASADSVIIRRNGEKAAKFSGYSSLQVIRGVIYTATYEDARDPSPERGFFLLRLPEGGYAHEADFMNRPVSPSEETE